MIIRCWFMREATGHQVLYKSYGISWTELVDERGVLRVVHDIHGLVAIHAAAVVAIVRVELPPGELRPFLLFTIVM